MQKSCSLFFFFFLPWLFLSLRSEPEMNQAFRWLKQQSQEVASTLHFSLTLTGDTVSQSSSFSTISHTGWGTLQYKKLHQIPLRSPPGTFYMSSVFAAQKKSKHPVGTAIFLEKRRRERKQSTFRPKPHRRSCSIPTIFRTSPSENLTLII